MNFSTPPDILGKINMEGEPRMSARASSDIYNAVIDDVIEAAAPVFLNENVDYSVLLELKRLWKTKLCLNDDKLQVAKFRDPKVPDRIETAVARMNPEPPSDNQLQLLHVKDGVSTWSFNNDLMKKILEYSNKGNSLGVVINVPQEDGSAAQPQQTPMEAPTCALQSYSSNLSQGKCVKRRKVLQVDGQDSSSDEDSSSASMASSKQNDNDDEFDEDPLNSDDDITEGEDGASETDNILVCQYEKISRRSNRWKLHLKAGVMNLNGEDYIFNRLTGEVLW